MTITFDGFTEVSTGYSIDLDDTNSRGLCLLNDIWRVGNGSDIKAFTNTFVADTDNDITLSGLTTGENVRGLTTDGTNLIALTRNDAGELQIKIHNFFRRHYCNCIVKYTYRIPAGTFYRL